MFDPDIAINNVGGVGDGISYSFVIPVYNEEESVKLLLSELVSSALQLGKSYEVIFVDDCSSDRSSDIILEFEREFPDVVRYVSLDKRSGQTIALRKGLDMSVGDIVITLDADLQNDPADCCKMIEKMKEGFDCVCGWRRSRKDTLIKAGLSKFGNVLQRLFTGMSIHDVSCTLRAYDKKCINKIPLNWEGQHRFIPLSLSLQGYRVGEVESNHRERKHGKTKYNHRRIFKVVFDFFKVLKEKGRK